MSPNASWWWAWEPDGDGWISGYDVTVRIEVGVGRLS